jgi:hypothetical protein
LVGSAFAALFFAQLSQQSLGGHWLLFLAMAAVTGIAFAWLLLFTRWSVLSTVLAGLAVIFPLWFLLFSPTLEKMEHFAAVPPQRQNPEQPLPDITFIILDELPLTTLLDNNKQVDEKLFPGFARLQSMSDWYYNTTSVSAGTLDAVPAILTGQARCYLIWPLSTFTGSYPIAWPTIYRMSRTIGAGSSPGHRCFSRRAGVITPVNRRK